MDQALALEILLAGESALLTGPAGSGKTYVLNQFIRHAKSGGKHVAVTATTGLAATHLGGGTIHAWSGIGIHDRLPKDFYNNFTKGRRDIINKTDVLIIDEVSMLHDYRLDMVDAIARRVRENDSPFGGLQVILCGDFFQLPPVNRSDDIEGSFVIESAAWSDLDPVVCYLQEQHRQNDDNFLDILNALRAGDVRRHHAEQLLSRRGANVGDVVTELHTTNVDVDHINAEQLSRLPGDEHVFDVETTDKEVYVENMLRSCLAQQRLVLKVGALVMCIKNNPEKRYVNGSLGVVTGFNKTSGYPIVELKDGRTLEITPDTWELRDGDKKRASLTQVPLRLAWAITVHKSQGMTLDAARVDLRRAFVEGMGYVALSRVRSLDTLSLVGINQMALKVSPKALEMDTRLQNKSALHAKRFEHMRAKAEQRAKNKVTPVAKAGTWTEKLARMRQTYPNAYMPWKEADDTKLIRLFGNGKSVSIKKLTKEMGRHPGSIRSRLIKHFGEDAIVEQP